MEKYVFPFVHQWALLKVLYRGRIMLIKDVDNSILICIFVIPVYTLIRCFDALAMQLTCKYDRIRMDSILYYYENQPKQFK